MESAIAAAEKASRWRAGRITMETEVLDKEGNPEKRSVVIMELAEDGKSYRIASITEDDEKGEGR